MHYILILQTPVLRSIFETLSRKLGFIGDFDRRARMVLSLVLEARYSLQQKDCGGIHLMLSIV